MQWNALVTTKVLRSLLRRSDPAASFRCYELRCWGGMTCEQLLFLYIFAAPSFLVLQRRVPGNRLELPVKIRQRVETARVTHLRHRCLALLQQLTAVPDPDLR